MHPLGRHRVGQRRYLRRTRRAAARPARPAPARSAATPSSRFRIAAASSAPVVRAGAQRADQLRVRHRHRLAQPVRLAREVPAHLVGAQVRLGEQVTDADQRHRPAVGGVGREVLQHAERRRLAVHGALDGGPQAGDLLAADRAQRPVQLEVGVDPGRHPPVQLEQQFLAERHRGVALLGARAPGPATRWGSLLRVRGRSAPSRETPRPRGRPATRPTAPRPRCRRSWSGRSS